MGFEAFDGAEGDYVESGSGKGFGARGLYIDVRQCKGAGDFAEEGGLLVIGFDQGQGDLGDPEFYGDAGESGAGAYVGEAGVERRALGVGRFGCFGSLVRLGNSKTSNHRGHGGHRGSTGEEVTGGEKAFAEVAGDDFFGVADGG